MHPDWHGPDTLPAFWRMVSEHDVGTIVSMSRTGRGFTGFAPWWPQGGAGSEATFGEFRVRCASEETTASPSPSPTLTLALALALALALTLTLPLTPTLTLTLALTSNAPGTRRPRSAP